MKTNSDVLLDRLIRKAGNDGKDHVLTNQTWESYVAGTLDPDERTRVDRLLSQSPELREDLALFAEASIDIDQPGPAPAIVPLQPWYSLARLWPIAIPVAAAAAVIFFALPNDSTLNLDGAEGYRPGYFELNSRSVSRGELEPKIAAGGAFRKLIHGIETGGSSAPPEANRQSFEITLRAFGPAVYEATIPQNSRAPEVRIMTIPGYEVFTSPLSKAQTQVNAPSAERIAVTIVYELDGKFFATPAEEFSPR